MSKNKLFPVLSILLALTVLASGCGTPDPSALTDDQVKTVTGNILSAIDAGDYAAFTQDFSDEMLAAFPEDQFTQVADMLHNASGNFVSTGDLSLSNKQGYALYRIVCKYDQEDVVVTVVIKIGGDKVDGLFFDSPNMRNAQ